MAALVQNIVVEQGASFAMTMTLLDDAGDPLDTTGYSACSQIRHHLESTNAVNFSTTLSNGQLVLTLSSNTTANLETGRYLWDAKLDDGMGTVIRIVEGTVTVDGQVSR